MEKIYSAVLLLLCACIMTIGGTMARFCIQSEKESRAYAASFEVYVSPQDQNAVYKNDSGYFYDFTISNHNETVISEVAITYDVVVLMPEEFSVLQGSDLILITMAGSEKYPSLSKDNDGKLKYIFGNAGNFDASISATHKCSLHFVIRNDVGARMDIQGIEVYIVAKQID